MNHHLLHSDKFHSKTLLHTNLKQSIITHIVAMAAVDPSGAPSIESHTDRLLVVLLPFDHENLLTGDGHSVDEVLQDHCGHTRFQLGIPSCSRSSISHTQVDMKAQLMIKPVLIDDVINRSEENSRVSISADERTGVCVLPDMRLKGGSAEPDNLKRLAVRTICMITPAVCSSFSSSPAD